jgi:hypothetical protein
MSGYIGYEENLRNNSFLSFLISESNINFIKNQVDFFLKDAHPKKIPIQVTKRVVHEHLVKTYHQKKHVSSGDMFSKIHQCHDTFRNSLKEVNDAVIVFLVESIQSNIDHDHRYDGLSVWRADVIHPRNPQIQFNKKLKTGTIDIRR